MRTVQISADKTEFLEFLEFASRVRSLKFSMDPHGGSFPSYRTGWSKKASRKYIKDGPSLFQRVATEHDRNRPEGGRFRIDFQGAYSFEAKHYFIIWRKSADLKQYESKVPTVSQNPMDRWAMMAKAR
jgi:hypothetical protein